MMSPTRSRIEKEANATLLEYRVRLNRRLAPPIAVKSIAQDLYGFKVLEDEFERETDAKLYIKDKVILLNAIYPATRKRFSISHEIYHIKHKTLHKPIHRDQDIDWVEKRANMFAAYLLLPRRLVYECLIREIQNQKKKEDLGWMLELVRISEGFSVASTRNLLNSINRLLLGFLPKEYENSVGRLRLFALMLKELARRFEVSQETLIYQLRDFGLAHRFTSFRPNEKAPISGRYRIIWPDGEMGSKKVDLDKGQPFPPLPRDDQRYVFEQLVLI